MKQCPRWTPVIQEALVCKRIHTEAQTRVHARRLLPFKDKQMRWHIPARILCIFLRRGPYSRHSCFRMGIRRWEGSSRRPPDVMALHRSTEFSFSVLVFNSSDSYQNQLCVPPPRLQRLCSDLTPGCHTTRCS